MSIKAEIERIGTAVSDALAAIAAHGVGVPEGSTANDLAGLIAGIEVADVTVYSGASPDPSVGEDGDIFLVTE